MIEKVVILGYEEWKDEKMERGRKRRRRGSSGRRRNGTESIVGLVVWG